MNSDQAALLEKAQESLHAARLLAGNNMHDFAASRAYYTMFYVAEALLLEEGLSFSSHSAVIAAFGKNWVRPGKAAPEFHKYLREAFEARSQGDYETGPGLTAEECESHIQRAEMFIELGSRLLGSSPRE